MIYYFISLVNEDFEDRELIHFCVPRVHHVVNDCGRLFTALPIEDSISIHISKWLVVPPCGRNISPHFINTRFDCVTCFGQWMWASQVSSEALRAFVWFSHPWLDPRVRRHMEQSRSWLAVACNVRENNKQQQKQINYLSFWLRLCVSTTSSK